MVSDPVFDALYEKARMATTLEEVLQIFRDANEYVARQHIAISVLQPMAYSLCQPWIKGFNAQFGSTWGQRRVPDVELLSWAILDKSGSEEKHGALDSLRNRI